jgi:hypothetical protein
VPLNAAGQNGSADAGALAAFGQRRNWPLDVATRAIMLAKENKEDWRCFCEAYDAGTHGEP